MACVRAQQLLTVEPWPDNTRLHVRIGVHSGLAAPRDGDYVALAVHQAARVVSTAHGDQIIASQFTVDLVGPRPDAMRLDSLGSFRVRDFDGGVELFQVTTAGLQTEFSAPHAIPAAGHNLVRPATPFFGRESEIAALVEHVAPARIVTVLGPGGVGKTRLVTEFGLRCAPDWEGGVWLAALSPVGDPAHLCPAVAAALGARREPDGDGDPMREIVGQLRASPIVLILDNCEHLTAATSRLASTLLAEAPTAALVATSREPLGIAGEHVIRIAPLHVDAAGHEGRSLSPATELFRDRATAAQHSFTLDDSTFDDVTAICRDLDGLPLAIELAAARVGVMSPAAIRGGLDRSLAILRSPVRDAPARQFSLETLLAWSYDLLSGVEQDVFRRLGVFASGFGLDAAAAAAGGRTDDPLAVADQVWSLMDKSLVVADVAADENRYRMLTIVRRFARDRLDSCSETAGVARRVANVYADRLGPEHDVEHYWLGEMTLEIDNLRALIALLAPTDAELAQLLASSILQYHDITQSLQEGIEAAISFQRDLTAETPTRVGLLVCAAKLYGRSRDLDATDAAISEAKALRETLAEPPWAAGILANTAGLALLHRGDPGAALGAGRSRPGVAGL